MSENKNNQNQKKYRYSLKPLFLKNNSVTWLKPSQNFIFEKGGMLVFPVILSLHYVKNMYFPDNICVRNKKPCQLCNDGNKNTTLYAIFPAEVNGENNDVRLIFMPVKYFPKDFFLPGGKLNKEKYLEYADKTWIVEIKNKIGSFKAAYEKEEPKPIDLTPQEQKAIRNRLFPYRIWGNSKRK